MGELVCQVHVVKRLRKEPIKAILDGSILDQITEKEWKWLGRDKEVVKQELQTRVTSLRPVLEELHKLSQDPKNKIWDGLTT